MKELGAWLQGTSKLHPAPVRAALAHLELVGIHPFEDGNGRTARALAHLLLVEGNPLLGSLSLEKLFGEKDRAGYCKVIEKTFGLGYISDYDATPFVAYFVSALSKTIRREFRLPIKTSVTKRRKARMWVTQVH